MARRQQTRAVNTYVRCCCSLHGNQTPPNPHPRLPRQRQHPPIRLPSKWAVSMGTGQLPFDDGSHDVTPADSASSSESPAGRRWWEGGGKEGGRWVGGWMLTERNDEESGRLLLLTQLRPSSSSVFGPLRAGFSWFFRGPGRGENTAGDQMSPADSRAPRSIQVS